MQKILITILILCIFSSNVYAEQVLQDEHINTLLKYDIIKKNDIYISRAEAVECIMKIIGADDNMSYYYTTILSSVKTPLDDASSYGYVSIAVYPRVAKGWNDKFFPEKPVTYKHALMFMVRCLKKYDEPEDEKQMMADAEEMGLINKNDSFCNNLDDYALRTDFYEILYRFLNAKRYLYIYGFKYMGLEERFESKEEYEEYLKDLRTDIKYLFEYCYDEEHSMTYLEYLDYLASKD